MSRRSCQVAIVGAGPAGLFAAEKLAEAGLEVTIFERLASPARKFLLAGRGGLNLTHSEPRAAFLARYGAAGPWLRPGLDAFPPAALRAWAEGLGQKTFVGSSGRVFPESFKASPLARAWLARLEAKGVTLATRRRFTGFGPAGALLFDGPDGGETVKAKAVLLALGGASWPRMGSDGAWVGLLAARGVAITPLEPANMGIEIDWSPEFAARFAGQPLKRIAITVGDRQAEGEAVITAAGLEGGVVYALSAPIRAALADGKARLAIDLKPDLAQGTIAARIAGARTKDSLSSRLKKRLGLTPQAIGVLHEAVAGPLPRDPARLAALIKAAVIDIQAVRPIERAISTAGGVSRDAVSAEGELAALPGVFVAGEMLDWEAPTGGYLLQATFATAVVAARGIARRLGVTLEDESPIVW
ncbi:NAD(P)/FAD-dependent oxidoreductase [Phreatobacter stygius]|uniref:TIGR03862 family flavoprotein n=1 Tax=Phreatobacter stygius TaxID=1940610 RepID=A0A4D7ATR6_9HYPH|nr:TIGR03862 family flavoprotein [Phreatobacter stygius]QCI64954.1 TIGR03862 family flavoprotein [Phreatobacter stygius]